jgi:excisionase family DNA binding protein
MRDKQGYREQIERLAEIYPNKITLSLTETASALGIDKRTVLVLIEKKKLPATDISNGSKNKRYIIPITAIARMVAG